MKQPNPATNKLKFVDSHCHIHDNEFEFKEADVYKQALLDGVDNLVCVGTSVKSSLEAVKYAQSRLGCHYSIALHPHEVAGLSHTQLELAWQSLEKLANQQKNDPKFVAVGECGLDFYYHQAEEVRKKQEWLLSKHLNLAKKLKKPVIFHVRDAFTEFWPIYDEFNLPGVVHSFSSGPSDLEQILARKGLFIGLNGIMTFTTDEKQLESARKAPITRLLLETDAPYLTPKPLRGTINTPTNVRLVAQFLSDLRKEPLGLLADQTTANARMLFGI